MTEINNSYDDAVSAIKAAILQSQYEAARSVNEKQLMLYYGIGKYISLNSRKGFWGKGAIDTISERLQKELPGLRGFSARNLRNMRIFYEEWIILDRENAMYYENNNLAESSAKLGINITNSIWQTQVPNYAVFPFDEFFRIGFSHHTIILSMTKDIDERIFYIKQSVSNQYSYDSLKKHLREDDYHHRAQLPNNFLQTMSSTQQALRAINVFKDEYLLDFINVEELNSRDDADIDEPMGVATYKTSKDMSEELKKALPDIESLKKLLESDGII